MRTSLRRSCDACARSKLRCDLLSPQCSRCVKKGLICVYANEPLSSVPSEQTAIILRRSSSESQRSPTSWTLERSSPLNESHLHSFDPFDSYPRTRLPRMQVQQLIQHFLSSIAFQYYPLDLDSASNPFVVSWWPLALADPALFHVSLQTASLDMDLRSQRGFATSDLLMADSVSLVRSKVDVSPTAVQDELLDSVVTLAAIEFGKGNLDVSSMHIEGVKSMVKLRGGIDQVKSGNPLTARMVSWVSLVLLQSPQFDTQDDYGNGTGITPPRQWIEAASKINDQELAPLRDMDIDFPTYHNLLILDQIFRVSDAIMLPTAALHDLACFVLHRLLALSSKDHKNATSPSSPSSAVQSATSLFMLILHGPTYFSHALLQQSLIIKLRDSISDMLSTSTSFPDMVLVWLVSVGLIASEGMRETDWFTNQAESLADSLHLTSWNSVLSILRSVLWLDRPQSTYTFRRRWEEIFDKRAPMNP